MFSYTYAYLCIHLHTHLHTHPHSQTKTRGDGKIKIKIKRYKVYKLHNREYINLSICPYGPAQSGNKQVGDLFSCFVCAV